MKGIGEVIVHYIKFFFHFINNIIECLELYYIDLTLYSCKYETVKFTDSL